MLTVHEEQAVRKGSKTKTTNFPHFQREETFNLHGNFRMN
jgi:hypothetical protein